MTSEELSLVLEVLDQARRVADANVRAYALITSQDGGLDMAKLKVGAMSKAMELCRERAVESDVCRDTAG